MMYKKSVFLILVFFNSISVVAQSTSSTKTEEIKSFISSEDLEKLNTLITPTNSNLLDSSGTSLFTHAIRTKNLEMVKLFLKNKVNVNLQNQDYYQSTPLMNCVSSNLIDIAKLLIKNGANVNAQDKFGDPVIHWSAYMGQEEFTELLLKHKASTHLKSSHANGAMQVALKEYKTKISDLLVDFNVLLHRVSKHEKKLISAVKTNNVNNLIALLNEQNSNSLDQTGSALLIIAAEKGHLEIVKLLVERGAHINIMNPVGHTALNRASFFGHKPVVSYLLAQGADPNKTDLRFKLTPLIAASRTNQIDIGTLLLKHDASINDTDGINNFSPIMWATAYDNVDFIKLLLKYNADLSIVSTYDSTVNDLTRNEEILSLLENTDTKPQIIQRNYCTEIGRFDLTFYDDEISGSYILLPKQSAGAIWGKLNNKEFVGRWIDGDGQGDIKLTFNNDYSWFTTSYRADDDPNKWYTDQWHGQLRPDNKTTFKKNGKQYRCE